jgi:hypothetical protein
LRALERITHPAIAVEIARRVAEAGSDVVVVESPSRRTSSVPAGCARSWPISPTTNAAAPGGPRDGGGRHRTAHVRAAVANWLAGRGRWLVSTAGTREEVTERVHRLWQDVIRRK